MPIGGDTPYPVPPLTTYDLLHLIEMASPRPVVFSLKEGWDIVSEDGKTYVMQQGYGRGPAWPEPVTGTLAELIIRAFKEGLVPEKVRRW